MLDIKRLRYLEAVYRCRNFTRASEELFVSQPAISAAVSAMERELDVKLIVRTPKEVTFTLEGEQFMRHVFRILKEFQAAEELAADFSKTRSGTLRLGVSPTLSGQFLPMLYEDFLPGWPGAVVHLDEGSMRDHIEKIQNDVLDLSYNALPEPGSLPGLSLVPVTSTEVCVLMRPQHPLAAEERIPISALEGRDIVTLNEKSQIRAKVTAELERHGIVPHVVSCHEQIICMVNMIRLGDYIGFINADRSYHALGCEELIVRPFAEPIRFDVGFLLKQGKQIPRISRELIAFTQKTMEP